MYPCAHVLPGVRAAAAGARWGACWGVKARTRWYCSGVLPGGSLSWEWGLDVRVAEWHVEGSYWGELPADDFVSRVIEHEGMGALVRIGWLAVVALRMEVVVLWGGVRRRALSRASIARGVGVGVASRRGSRGGGQGSGRTRVCVWVLLVCCVVPCLSRVCVPRAFGRSFCLFVCLFGGTGPIDASFSRGVPKCPECGHSSARVRPRF